MNELWTGDFGNEYTKRNDHSTLEARRSIWKLLLPDNCHSILEVGSNIGLNLEAISDISEAELYATEPNDKAREALDWLPAKNVRSDCADRLGFSTASMDLVFTSGVLIHVPPTQITQSIKEIHRVSKRWIICAEYFAPQEEMIPYRGHNDALWRRDYGSLFMDYCPDLHPVMNPIFAWKKTTGLDNLTIWVFEKGPMRH